MFQPDSKGEPADDVSSLQINAKHPDTFRPDTISLPQLQYGEMMKGMNLPIKALGTTACVGPLFWWDLVETSGKKRLGDRPKLRMRYQEIQANIHQKSFSGKPTSKNRAVLAAGSCSSATTLKRTLPQASTKGPSSRISRKC